jgi:hypothetical protein
MVIWPLLVKRTILTLAKGKFYRENGKYSFAKVGCQAAHTKTVAGRIVRFKNTTLTANSQRSRQRAQDNECVWRNLMGTECRLTTFWLQRSTDGHFQPFSAQVNNA